MCLMITEECLRFPPRGPNWSFGFTDSSRALSMDDYNHCLAFLVNLVKSKHPSKAHSCGRAKQT